MQCPSCGAASPAGALVCEHCGRGLPREPGTGPRPAEPRSDKYQIEETGFETRIWWRWWSPLYIGVAIFAIAWNAFLFGWYAMAAGMPSEFGVMRYVMLIFPLAHVAVGAGMAYTALCGFLNRTVIAVGDGLLTVRHTPLPFAGQVSIPVSDVEQLYVVQTLHQGENTISQRYNLRALLTGNQSQDVLKGLDNPSDALFLEQTLERVLRITDRPVAGELPRL